ncbi:dienelactone hydrolase family protein [Bailinhaonella thermotolerans]|uniref:Hydrolase n=1 Tax=Bailinhaonella thermotolerans TaxID=1070861 RepID=A0A3A4A6S6_9ACTN|nr:alpha/beta family hydrolase [Bailinhaonella thermotolerans]RJL22727.1 hydrolase [Bailinhaonella thermotolerans]
MASESVLLPVRTPIGEAGLDGDLAVPEGASGIVLFAHGSGSSRLSPRNQAVARALRNRGLGTLLLDLLTAAEEEVDAQTAEMRFDVAMLGDRLMTAVDWLGRQPLTADLPIGLFGASTGAAGALLAAAGRPAEVRAVVSRGGRPDLASEALSLVQAPTLLIVGGRDEPVIAMNAEAARELRAPHHLEIVEGATHLFEEPGALDRVAELAGDWFTRHLGGAR